MNRCRVRTAHTTDSPGVQIKNLQHLVMLEVYVKSLAVTYFHMGTPTLSSALSSFTSEFEMGSGGSHLLMPPGKTFGRK